MKKNFIHEKLVELLAIPLSDQRTVAKWLVNERYEKKKVGNFVSFVFFVDTVWHLK